MKTHGHDKPFEPHCLHCLLSYTIEAWAKKNGSRLEAAKTLAILADVTGEIVVHASDDATREHFEKFAHVQLRRAFRAENVEPRVVISFDRNAAA